MILKGIVHNSFSYSELILQPIFSNTPRLRKSFFQGFTIIIFQHFLQGIQFILIRINLLKQCLTVCQTDITPHFRGAASDAGEVAEAAAGKTEQVFWIAGAVMKVIHYGECQDMR